MKYKPFKKGNLVQILDPIVVIQKEYGTLKMRKDGLGCQKISLQIGTVKEYKRGEYWIRPIINGKKKKWLVPCYENEIKLI